MTPDATQTTDIESEASARRRLAELRAEREKLTAERNHCWSQVAETRAASLAAGALRGPLTYSDRRMQTLLAEREARREGIVSERAQRANAVAARVRRLEVAEVEAEREQRAFEQAQQAFDAVLVDDAMYQSLAKQAAQAQDAEAGLRERLIHAVAERDRKTEQYLSDPLFGYLRKRGFGRPDYRAAGLRYRLDRWVAAVAGYARAQRDFELLQEMPRWLEEQINTTADLAVEADAALTAYLDTQPGIQELRALSASAEQTATRYTELQAETQAAIEQERRLDDEAVAFAADDDVYTREIRHLYRQSFGGQPIEALLALAEQTGSDDDRRALHVIARIDRRLPDVEQRITQIETELGEDGLDKNSTGV